MKALFSLIALTLCGCSSTPPTKPEITPQVVRVFIIDQENPSLVFKRPAPTPEGRICEVCREPMWEEESHYRTRHNLKPYHIGDRMPTDPRFNCPTCGWMSGDAIAHFGNHYDSWKALK